MELSTADDGVGFPENLDFQNTTSLGLQLVMGLVRQLNGIIEIKSGQGTTRSITIPAGKNGEKGKKDQRLKKQDLTAVR